MMPRTKETTVYQFSELSDEAKERAREWYREVSQHDEWWEFVIDDAVEIGEKLGIEFATDTVRLMGGGSRQKPRVYFSGFSSQGDGACFEGTYSYAKGSVKCIKEHAPKDEELHRIALELSRIQRPYFYRLYATVKHTGHYNHEHSVSIEVCDNEYPYRDIGDAEEAVAEALRDFMRWIYRRLEKEWEWLNSDEQVDESIESNEYEFDEDGDRT